MLQAHGDKQTFEGTWRLRYWYPSNEHAGEDTSDYKVAIHQDGNQLVLQSLPSETNSYILVRLSLEDDIATGTWHEVTSPTGAFKGMIYSGALQLIIGQDKRRMEGKWVGVGRDYNRNRPDIFTGRWELEWLSDEKPAVKESPASIIPE